HYVDRIVLGAHNWSETKTWDPEGLVSTLPAVATFLFGTMAGAWLRDSRPLGERLAWLAGGGAGLIGVGLVCSHWLPINKKIWTSSFTIFMAGLDCVIYALTAWAVDERGWRAPVKPLVILGMNSIAVYVAAELLDVLLYMANVRDAIYETAFEPLGSA